jgi:carbohydrate-binding DOMON domain-containing protein
VGEIQSTYTAFGLAGFLGGTVRRLGPSRRGVLAVSWLLGVATAAVAVFGVTAPPLFRLLAYAFLVLLAGAGLAALAAINPLHAGRRRMIPVGVFFLLPLVVVWVKLFV